MDSVSYYQYLTRVAGLRDNTSRSYLTYISQAAKDMGLLEDALYKINSPSILKQMQEKLKVARKFAERPARKQGDMMSAYEQLVNFATTQRS